MTTTKHYRITITPADGRVETVETTATSERMALKAVQEAKMCPLSIMGIEEITRDQATAV